MGAYFLIPHSIRLSPRQTYLRRRFPRWFPSMYLRFSGLHVVRVELLRSPSVRSHPSHLVRTRFGAGSEHGSRASWGRHNRRPFWARQAVLSGKRQVSSIAPEPTPCRKDDA